MAPPLLSTQLSNAGWRHYYCLCSTFDTTICRTQYAVTPDVSPVLFQKDGRVDPAQRCRHEAPGLRPRAQVAARPERAEAQCERPLGPHLEPEKLGECFEARGANRRPERHEGERTIYSTKCPHSVCQDLHFMFAGQAFPRPHNALQMVFDAQPRQKAYAARSSRAFFHFILVEIYFRYFLKPNF